MCPPSVQQALAQPGPRALSRAGLRLAVRADERFLNGVHAGGRPGLRVRAIVSCPG